VSEEATLVQALAGMVVDTRERGLPDEVTASVRQRVLDILGICVAASDLPTSSAVRNFVTSQGGYSEATAIGVPGRVPAAWAALINGTLAHSLDYDDTHLPSVLHPSATVVPAALAAGQLVGASGQDLIVAIAVGLEICVRLGMAGYDEEARNSLYFDRGQHATSICGAIGAAASVASLLGLDSAGVANAMSVAVSMAGGVIEANRTGGTVKRIHCGWGAHAAISAAQLARFGITGPPTVFEGRFGFFRAFLDGNYHPEAITDGLGSTWSVPGINFKPYPANHFCHAGIDAALALRARGLRVEEVASLTLGVSAPVLHTVGEPIETKRRPETAYQAQFSGPYTVVAGLLGGHCLGLGLDDFTDELARNPVRRALMAKVDVVADAGASDVFPRQFAAVLTAVTSTGAVLEERVMTNRGGTERPLSDDELGLKFADNARRALSDTDIAFVQEAVWSLEKAPNLEPCLARLATDLSPVSGPER
jgi:2-methylcitrate dehydratase PrpD